jgi:hypothetical protein
MTMQEVLETRECDTDDGAELWVIGIVESDGWANDECVTPSRTVPPPGGAQALDRKWGQRGGAAGRWRRCLRTHRSLSWCCCRIRCRRTENTLSMRTPVSLSLQLYIAEMHARVCGRLAGWHAGRRRMTRSTTGRRLTLTERNGWSSNGADDSVQPRSRCCAPVLGPTDITLALGCVRLQSV